MCSGTDKLTFTRLLSFAYIVQLITSLPTSLDNGAGLGGIIVTMVLSGLGHGGLSAVMYPFIGEFSMTQLQVT